MYCSKCGATMADGAAFCSACGQRFSVNAGAAPVITAPAASVPVYARVPIGAAAPRAEYAGFWLRLFAFVVDNLIMGVAVVMVFIPLLS